MNRPTRRGLLAGAAALAAAPAVAAPPPHPDADLLALASRFIDHERLIQTMPCDAETEAQEAAQDVEQHRLLNRKRDLVLAMGELRATTADGIAARARCLAVHNADGAFSMDAPGTTTSQLLLDLVRDAGALGGAGRPVAVSPDADLVKACAAFDHLQRAFDAIPATHLPGSAEEDAADAERERICEQQAPLVDRMCQLRAVTREGAVTRARSLVLWDKELMKERGEAAGERLTEAIVRDLVEEGT